MQQPLLVTNIVVLLLTCAFGLDPNDYGPVSGTEAGETQTITGTFVLELIPDDGGNPFEITGDFGGKVPLAAPGENYDENGLAAPEGEYFTHYDEVQYVQPVVDYEEQPAYNDLGDEVHPANNFPWVDNKAEQVARVPVAGKEDAEQAPQRWSGPPQSRLGQLNKRKDWKLAGQDIQERYEVRRCVDGKWVTWQYWGKCKRTIVTNDPCDPNE